MMMRTRDCPVPQCDRCDNLFMDPDTGLVDCIERPKMSIEDLRQHMETEQCVETGVPLMEKKTSKHDKILEEKVESLTKQVMELTDIIKNTLPQSDDSFNKKKSNEDDATEHIVIKFTKFEPDTHRVFYSKTNKTIEQAQFFYGSTNVCITVSPIVNPNDSEAEDVDVVFTMIDFSSLTPYSCSYSQYCHNSEGMKEFIDDILTNEIFNDYVSYEVNDSVGLFWKSE